MEISLRPYQQDFIDAVRNEFQQKHKRVVGVAPCGAGKTIMTGWMIRESLNRGKKSIFFVHRKELIEQTAKTFNNLKIPFGIIAAGAPSMLELPVQIASIQTLARRVGWLKKFFMPDFLICDECHHILASSYKNILNAFPDAYLLGVTATPMRMGGVTLADSFDSMVESLTVNQLIELGNLTRFQYFAPEFTVDLSKVKVVHGDYSNDEIAKIMTEKNILGDIVENYRKYADGKSAICYCVNVEHSETVAGAFLTAGIPAAHCDGTTDKSLRAHIVDQFRRGKIKVLCNAELFGEGFDVPGCQAVILARPTKSLTLFIQQAMRPLRPDPNDPNKVAVIIDHVQNYLWHGMPNDDREWSLIPNIKKKVKCPHCGRMVTPKIQVIGKERHRVCPACGWNFEKSEAPPTVEVKVVDRAAELRALTVNFDTKKAAATPVVTQKPKHLDEFLAIAKRKGYKPQWAGYQAVEFANSYDECLVIARACGFKDGWAHYRWQERCAQKLKDTQTLQNARLAC